MERKHKILRNAIQCKICGEIVESKSTHDFVTCKCWRESKGQKGCACDGGLSYLRWLGNPDEFTSLAKTRLFTDEERDMYNKNADIINAKYGLNMEKMN